LENEGRRFNGEEERKGVREKREGREVL